MWDVLFVSHFSLISNGLQEGSTPPSFLIYHAPLLEGVISVSTEICFFPFFLRKGRKKKWKSDELAAHLLLIVWQLYPEKLLIFPAAHLLRNSFSKIQKRFSVFSCRKEMAWEREREKLSDSYFQRALYCSWNQKSGSYSYDTCISQYCQYCNYSCGPSN